MKYLMMLILLWLALLAPAHAALNIAATTASLGAVARAVGGLQVQVTVLAPPDRDVHTLQVKPSLLVNLRQADLVLAMGSELEIGWLPAALQAGANPRLLPGQPGYFEATAWVALHDVGKPADRALGDVHPQGNPHIHLDPLRMAKVAAALAQRLGQLDAAHSDSYRQRADEFAQAVYAKLPQWQARLAHAPGVVMYHADGDYFLLRFNIPRLGYLEPLPGVPPSAAHLKGLIDKLRGQRGVVLYHPYQAPQAANTVAEALGWSARSVAAEPAKDATAAEYFAFIELWVAAVAGV
jgi:zinc/manganese transport system substrate-binding protein